MGGLTFLFFLWLLGAPLPVSGVGLSRPTERHAVARQVLTPTVRLTVTPPRPTLNEAIIIGTDGIWSDACVPVYKTHQITANRVQINAVRPVNIICGQIPTPWSLSIWFDPLPAGTYAVDLLIANEDGTGSFTYTTTFTVTLTSNTRLITSAGGALTQQDRGQRATLVVAPGGVVTSTLFTLSYQPAPTTTDPLLPIGHVVALRATPTGLRKPLTLTLHYSDTLRGPVIADTIQLYRLQSGQWVTDGITITARLTDGLIAQITELSAYRLLGRTNRLYVSHVQR